MSTASILHRNKKKWRVEEENGGPFERWMPYLGFFVEYLQDAEEGTFLPCTWRQWTLFLGTWRRVWDTEMSGKEPLFSFLMQGNGRLLARRSYHDDVIHSLAVGSITSK